MTLVEFLTARLTEDEQVARATMRGVNRPQGEWTFAGMQVRDERDHLVVQHTWPNEGEHIARHDPARVLRDVEAKRRIIDEHYPIDPCDAHDAALESIACPTLRLLALPYATHPDYREEWRP